VELGPVPGAQHVKSLLEPMDSFTARASRTSTWQELRRGVVLNEPLSILDIWMRLADMLILGELISTLP
jgi:hypothetical protein